MRGGGGARSAARGWAGGRAQVCSCGALARLWQACSCAGGVVVAEVEVDDVGADPPAVASVLRLRVSGLGLTKSPSCEQAHTQGQALVSHRAQSTCRGERFPGEEAELASSSRPAPECSVTASRCERQRAQAACDRDAPRRCRRSPEARASLSAARHGRADVRKRRVATAVHRDPRGPSLFSSSSSSCA